LVCENKEKPVFGAAISKQHERDTALTETLTTAVAPTTPQHLAAAITNYKQVLHTPTARPFSILVIMTDVEVPVLKYTRKPKPAQSTSWNSMVSSEVVKRCMFCQ
jgi:hypothetical protein